MSIHAEIQSAVESAIEDARCEVRDGSGGGHFVLKVISPAFEGKSLLQKQRMVLSSIKHLMAGDAAPVHAIDKIETALS